MRKNIIKREISSDEEVLNLPVSVTEGLGKKKLKIKATYSKVPTKNNLQQNENNNSNFVRFGGDRRDAPGVRNGDSDIFQPSTRGTYAYVHVYVCK